jgi:hypothetical protein
MLDLIRPGESMMNAQSERSVVADAVERVQLLRTRHPVGNAILDRLRAGNLGMEHLRGLVGVEHQAHQAELAAYGLVMARFPHSPAAEFYARLTQLITNAQPKLAECAQALGMTDNELRSSPIGLNGYAFSGTLSWIALTGSQAANGLALHTDMAVYFSGCADLVAGLRDSNLAAPAEFLSYYEGGQSDELVDMATATVGDGIARGDDPDEAVAMARLLEESIGRFWQAAADADKWSSAPIPS